MENQTSTLQRIAKPLIVLATLIWGSSFVVMKNSLDSLPTFYLLAFRFTPAAILLGLFFWKRWKVCDKQYLVGGTVMGALLFTAYAFQTYGLGGTTPGKNAFLTGAYCIIVPFLGWAVSKNRPDKFNLIAAVLCLVGIGLVSLKGDLTVTLGDGLTLVGAFFFAAHILAVAHYSEDRDIFILTALQFASFAVLSWICALLVEGPPPFAALDKATLASLAYLVVLASCGALLFQNIGQKYTSPSTAAVLLSLEAPFGVIFSIFFAQERPTLQMFLGFGLIFVAVICSETKFAFLRKKQTAER